MSNTNLIPTAHIDASLKGEIAKTVIMPGDPLRAKFIADNFLTEVTIFNTTRNMFGYTGIYNGEKISVMGSGMGMPSIGIYSFELYSFYDVDNIIRVGSAGSYTKDLNLYDVVVVESSYSESTFAEIVLHDKTDTLMASSDLNKKILNTANDLGIKVFHDKIHSSDVFYRKNFDDYKTINANHGAICVEMESFALFANAIATNKKAACILTISDSLVSNEKTTSKERETAFTNMMKIALETNY